MEQQTEQQSKDVKFITKDTIIGKIVTDHPDKAVLLSSIMAELGIHCTGCGAAGLETLGQGVLSHGFDENDLEKLLADLNRAISAKTEEAPKKVIEDFNLSLTSAAINKVKQISNEEKKENPTLRVSVLAGGCSGYTYDLEIVEQALKTDLNFRQEDLNIAVDKESLEQLNGMEVDFIDTLKESGFKFNNPNASKECGCGKSFS